MIEYIKGDLFSVTEGIIAHGCNCQGVMGSGVAKIVKEKYPKAFLEYAKLCSRYNEYDSYTLLGTAQNVVVDYKYLVIYNLFTQNFYGTGDKHVNYEAVYTSFSTMFAKEEMNAYTINIPKIGAGLGGGDWKVIEAIINSANRDDRLIKVWEL